MLHFYHVQSHSARVISMRDSGFRGRRSFGPREMHKATCSDCGKECEVPFQPTEGRPVYCQDCLPKHRKPRF